jgi:hypothetical protein
MKHASYVEITAGDAFRRAFPKWVERRVDKL